MTIDGVPAIALPPVWREDVQQAVFRHLLSATSYPGSVQRMDCPLGEAHAQVACAATLIDQATTFADPSQMMDESAYRFLGVTPGDSSAAAFVIADGSCAPQGWEPRRGSELAPEEGATVIIRVSKLSAEVSVPADGAAVLDLRGPGIRDLTQVAITGLDPAWLEARRRWCALPPTGVDLILADHESVVAIPRTTVIAGHEIVADTMGGVS